MSVNAQSLAFGAQKSAIREIAAYAAQRKAAVGPENVYDFSLGNPSIPAPAQVAEAIIAEAQADPVQLHSYTPASGLPQVRAAIADSLQRRFGAECEPVYGESPVAQADDLYLTCGAAASLSICLNALVDPGDEVIVISPYFPEYKVWIETAGARCVEVPANAQTFEVDVWAVDRAITPRTRAVIINSPNNPVGVVYSRQNVAMLGQQLIMRSHDIGHTIQLISDEPYREVTYGAEVPWVPALHPATLVCYSYSKSLSLPGERIGWVLVPPCNPDHDELVPAVAGAGRKLGFVCAPALFQRVIGRCVDLPCNVDAYAANRDALTEGLARIGYEFIEPQGAFYLWIKAPGGDAQAFCERARAYDLFVVPSDSFGCPGWVRAGYCVSHDTIVNSLPAWEQAFAAFA